MVTPIPSVTIVMRVVMRNADTNAGSGGPNMSSGSDAIGSDIRASADVPYLDASAYVLGVSSTGCKQRHGEY
jgi:hypothetical protein